MVVFPWIPRPLDQWLNPLWGSQMLALASTVGFGFIIWKGTGGTGTSGAPFGFTGAAAFIVGQIAQGAVFYSVSRPIEKRLREARSAEAS